MNSELPFEDRLLASSASCKNEPFITVAIPHYKQRRYLEVALASLFEQNYDDFEILVSDDKSPDDSSAIIPPLLKASGCSFRYYAQPSNLGYDGNVRFCLSAAKGRYVFLLGNDDALGGPTTLQNVANTLRQLNMPEVAFTSFADFGTGVVTRRAQGTRLLGTGPNTAIRLFRAFSFVSGLIFDRAAASQHETNRWDQSIYYQFYLACRIIATGGQVAALDICAVRQYVRIAGQKAPGTSPWTTVGWSLEPRYTGLDSVIRVTADAVLPLLPQEMHSATLRRIISQILTVSYPNALFHYRGTANWSFAVGVARRMWPGILLAEYRLPYRDRLYPEYRLLYRDRLYLWILYLSVTLAGLIVPTALFNRLRWRLSDFVQRRQQAT